MSKLAFNPYLNFNGDCREAMQFYQSIFGGELKLQTFAESGQAGSPQENDRIMHADLKNDSISFFASDGHVDVPVVFGDNVHLSLAGDDGPKLMEYFNKLADGGQVTMPLAKQFWGDTFGMVADKFGVHWMINISA